MKTNLNKIRQKCRPIGLGSKFATKLYATNVRFIRWASLFATLSFKIRWDHFFQCNRPNGALKHRGSESCCGCNRPTNCFFQVLHHKSCITGFANVTAQSYFYLFLLAYLFQSMGTYNGYFHRIIPVAELQHVRGKERPSLRTLLWRYNWNLPKLGWLISWYFNIWILRCIK